MKSKLSLLAISFSFISSFVSGKAIAVTAQPKSPASKKKTCGEGEICLAVKYVAYQDKDGKPVVSEDEANANIDGFNKLWSQCKISFEIEKFVSAKASDSGLNTNPANMGEMDDIRKAFQDDSELVVVTTGKWDRSGSLGNTGANAWTSMPGENLYGAVLEDTVATFSNIIAHELGHYLNLDHVSDQSNLMNPVIYDDSTTITPSQCETARASVTQYWQKMVR